MAITTVAITGHVLAPDGSAPTSGRLVIKLSQAGSTLDGTESVRVATEITEDLTTGGVVSFALCPNDLITPTGTYYLVTAVAQLASGRRVQWSEKWQLTSADLALDIGEVPRTDIQPGVAATFVGDWPAQAAAQVAATAASAAAADESEAAASAWASWGQAAASAASVSALAAQSAPGIYADTTAGLAATASGGYFYTPSTDPSVLILYLDNAGTAVEKGRIPSAVAVQELQASVPPRSTDTASNLDYAADAVGRVYRYTDASGGLMLAGRTASVQARLAEIDRVTVQATTPTAHDVAVDDAGRVLRYLAEDGGEILTGRTESVQTSIRRLEDQVASLYRPPGSVSLPSTFTPMMKGLRGEERYIWSGMPAALRPNQNTITAYPFEWDSSDLVLPSMMCRRQGTLNDHGRWEQITWGAEESITVNAPSNFFDDPDPNLRRQYRDGAHMFDRKAGLYYYCDSAITNTVSGWNARNIPIFSSADGLAWDFVAYTPDFVPSPQACKLATPDWFVDADGTLYMLISGAQVPTSPRNTWVLRCDNPDTMAAWTTVGEITGTALPVRTSLGLPETIDCYMMQRDGIYYFFWRAESAPDGTGSEDWGQMGIAWATSILGPYNSGHRFMAPSGEKMNGEGLCAMELPPGRPYRYRLFWDNYRARSYAGVTAGHMFADTNDFVTFTPPKPTGFPMTTNGKDRNTTFCIGY